MRFFNKEVGLIVPPKKQTKTIKIKSLNGYGAVREKTDEGNTLTVKQPVVTERTKPKVSIGFLIKLFIFIIIPIIIMYIYIYIYIYLNYGSP